MRPPRVGKKVTVAVTCSSRRFCLLCQDAENHTGGGASCRTPITPVCTQVYERPRCPTIQEQAMPQTPAPRSRLLGERVSRDSAQGPHHSLRSRALWVGVCKPTYTRVHTHVPLSPNTYTLPTDNSSCLKTHFAFQTGHQEK